MASTVWKRELALQGGKRLLWGRVMESYWKGLRTFR